MKNNYNPTTYYSPLGEDEEASLCHDKVKCTVGQFKCELSGDCVGREKVCDGVVDCQDKTDESRCNPGTELPMIPDCGMDHFICDDGICYHQDRICDGTQDCQDGTDEKMCHHWEENVKELEVVEDSSNTTSILVEWIHLNMTRAKDNKYR